MEQLWLGPSQLSRKRRPDPILRYIQKMCRQSPSLVRLYATIQTDDTRAPLMQPAPRGATHDKLTVKRLVACNGCLLLPRVPRFVCHRRATVQMFRNGLSIQQLRGDAGLQLAASPP